MALISSLNQYLSSTTLGLPGGLRRDPSEPAGQRQGLFFKPTWFHNPYLIPDTSSLPCPLGRCPNPCPHEHSSLWGAPLVMEWRGVGLEGPALLSGLLSPLQETLGPAVTLGWSMGRDGEGGRGRGNLVQLCHLTDGKMETQSPNLPLSPPSLHPASQTGLLQTFALPASPDATAFLKGGRDSS